MQKKQVNNGTNAVFGVCIVLSGAGYALPCDLVPPHPDISRLSVSAHHEVMANNKPVKSPVFNESNTTLHIQYKVCDYDYNEVKKDVSNIVCSALSTKDIAPQDFIEYEIKPAQVNKEVTHYQRIYINKVSNDLAYQYYIADINDALNYGKFLNTPINGVRQVASSCIVDYTGNIHLHIAGKGVLCSW